MSELERHEDAELLAVKMEQGAVSQPMPAALGAGKDKETEPPCSLQQGLCPADTLVFAP